MRVNTKPWKLFLGFFATVWLWGGEPQRLQASPVGSAPTVSCAQFLAPKRNVNGKMVGQEECLMQDHGIVEPNRKFRRVEMGITGTLAGWIIKEGPRANHFTSAPEFVFDHYGSTSPHFHGILRYEAAKGTSMTIIYPETGWNGKMFVMVHGAGGSFQFGTMKPWDQHFDSSDPMGGVTRYERPMLEKGYAVATTRRNASRDFPGDYSVVLDNGEVWPDQNVNQVPELPLDMARLARNFLKDRLGREAARIYWYGHSGGAMMGTLINYMSQLNPELNRDPDGTPTIDGFLWDDVGGGMFIPFLIRGGQDVLLRTPEQKTKFVKTIEIAHQAYPNVYETHQTWYMDINHVPEKVSPVYLTNKRTRARMMHDKGLDGVYRIYEVRGVSHNGGDALPESGKDGDVEILNLPRVMDGLVDLLDNWVEKGIEPPPSKADVDIGSGNQMNAVSMPEVACPLGVYYAYPRSRGFGGVGFTGFAPFDGQGVEPVDGRIVNVDMNGNGRRDKRETVTEAWRRLGLLKPGETFSRAQYVACVQSTVAKLRKENFITENVGNLYLEDAGKKELPAQ